MTDKEQIMIDGINVNGCKGYYFSPTGYHSCSNISQVNELGYEQDTLCEQNPNCHFKQLARKTQEYEELKKEIGKLQKSQFCVAYEKDCHKVCKQQNCAIKNSYKYRKALEEIEAIVKGMRSVFIEEISITANQLNDRIYRESTARFRQILDIINKAKGEGNENKV